jgi:hypothetical protein
VSSTACVSACGDRALLLCRLHAVALAQIASGALSGRIFDQGGTALPGATVTATNVTTRLARVGVTADNGSYVISFLPPGLYTIQIALDGFRPVTRLGVRMTTGESVRLDAELRLGGIDETIVVTGDPSLLRRDSAGLGQVIDNTRVTALPLNGRSFITLAGLAPGVALPPGSSLPRINGGRPRTNEYLFDGISVLQPEPARADDGAVGDLAGNAGRKCSTQPTRRHSAPRMACSDRQHLARLPVRATPASFNLR